MNFKWPHLKDYYKILNLDRSSTILEIRKSYRKLALEFHPDTNDNQTNSDKFILINEAYSVLKNIKSKVSYDKLYDFHFLNKSVRNSTRFNSKEGSRNENVSRQSNKGHNTGSSFAKKSKDEFRDKSEKASFWDGFSIIAEFLGTILSFFS